MKKLFILVIDGCSLEYITKESTPNLYRIAKEGFIKCVKATIPTVTNVNHATILTGKFPSEHGIIGNYYYNRDTDEHGFIENIKVNEETIIDHVRKKGGTSAFLSVKADVLDVFGKGVSFGICVERPNEILTRYLDMPNPPSIGCLNANTWILEACYRIMKKNSPDIVYCTTNDYMMHNYEPETREATAHMHEIDVLTGKIYDLDQTREIYITADHGINNKTTVINLQAIMNNKGFDVVCHPPVKDKHIQNHPYQEGGVLYLYLKNYLKKDEIIKFLENSPYIEAVCTKEEANRRYNLPIDKVGDFVVFSSDECAFGEIDGEILHEKVRTHGSLNERAIPLIAVNAAEAPEKYRYSRDIVRILLG